MAVLVYIEIQPRIQATHLLLSGDISAISLTSNSVSCSGGSEVAVYNWESPKLIFSVQPSIELVPQVGLSMRFRISRDQLSNSTVKSERDSPNSNSIKCRFCKNPLTITNNKFKRVLPLPSDAWYEFDAYCHGDHTPVHPTPREGDLLIGDSVLLVDGGSFSSERILITPESDGTTLIACKRCHSVCGRILDSNGTFSESISGTKIELQRAKVSDSSTEEAVTRTQSKREEYFAQKLQIFSKSKAAFRFKVCDQTGRIYLSACLMNTLSRIICSNCEQFSAVIQRFTDYSAKEDSQFVDRYAIKVMYKSHLSERNGKLSVGVEEMITLDRDECLELLLLLTHSTLTSPPSQRAASGYKIGFLSVAQRDFLSVK